MRYRATRLSRSDGFRWDDGTPLEYQRSADLLMGCAVSDAPYYVICGHVPLRVEISEGTRVDSRVNHVYTAQELEAAPDAAGGQVLIAAIAGGISGQGAVLFESRADFESALCYAAQHLPRSRTAHTVISENEGGVSLMLALRSGTPLAPAPEWTASLPVFSGEAAGMALPAADGILPTYDAVYDLLLNANSKNHSPRMLTFFSFACGGDFDPAALEDYTAYLQAFAPDPRLIERYFKQIPEGAFDAPEMLPILYGLTGSAGDRLLAACVRRYVDSDLLRQLQEQTPPPKAGTIVSSFARAYAQGYSQFPLDKAGIAELYALYQYITDSGMTADDLQGFLADDENSRSMIGLLEAQQGGTEPVTGVMPAVLYWYDLLSKEQCNALYDTEQTAARMRTQVKLLAVPNRMQKLEFRDEPRNRQPRRKLNLPAVIGAGVLLGVLLLGIGGLGGAAVYRKTHPAPEPPAETVPVTSTSAQTTVTTTQTTAVTTVPEPVGTLRTQQCRLDAASQTAAEEFLTMLGQVPEGMELSEAVVCSRITQDALAEFTPESPQQTLWLIPYHNADSAGLLCIAVQPDGSLLLEQTVPAPAPDAMPSLWFDLQEIERDLDARTAEPSVVLLLLCGNEDLCGQLVYTVSGGAAYVTPYQLNREALGTRMPLTEGSAYRLEDYLTWAQAPAAAETTTALPQ